jgi:ethanolamine ammonia-lyase large subunit
MDDVSVIQWVAGGTASLIFAGMGHLLTRVVSIERRQAEVAEALRKYNDEAAKALWSARDKDREQREIDQREVGKFREYVLTTLATKDDINALETRVAGVVRMVMNERLRKDDVNGRI